ncbi:unnamed protein product [Pleuronectes platessa]|uniref:Uncharacterized protein n=1 Tax=Pleuronectes platessa TaxID=8262 RepID=A0A9N7TRV8_PLEPL|nr:unnamed protein product [Pleuronectes platessa]
MTKDMYWNDCDARPPYTLAAADYCIPSFLGSTTDMGLSDILQFDEADVSDSCPRQPESVLTRHQETVLGRVRRLLSVQEPPELRPPRPIFKRHSSDATGSFFPEFRLSPGAGGLAPPTSLVTPPPPMDTLSTLREVNSSPASPEISPSAVFPLLLISPPVFDVWNKMDSSADAEVVNVHNVWILPPRRSRQAWNIQGPATWRQFSLQFSRQTSKSSVRSLPSPKGLGRRRRCLAQFQSRRSTGPPGDTLQLPDHEQDSGFQGTTEDDESDRTNHSKDVENNNSQSHSSGEKRESLT